MTDFQLDAKQLICPMPVIKTQDKIKQLNPGDKLIVTCTDPGAKNDIPAWCRINGHTLEDIQEMGQEILISITVGSNDASN